MTELHQEGFSIAGEEARSGDSTEPMNSEVASFPDTMGETANASKKPLDTATSFQIGDGTQDGPEKPNSRGGVKGKEDPELGQSAVAVAIGLTIVGLGALALLAADSHIRRNPGVLAPVNNALAQVGPILDSIFGGSPIAGRIAALPAAADQEFAKVQAEANAAASQVRPVVANVANSAVNTVAIEGDRAQVAVTHKEQIDLTAVNHALRRQDTVIVFNDPEAAPQSSLDLHELYSPIYKDANIINVTDSLKNTPEMQICLGKADLTMEQLGLETFALFQAQDAIDEINGVPLTKNHGRLTAVEVKDVWEGIGVAGRTELNRLFNVTELQRDVIKSGKYKNNESLNFYLSMALRAIRAREVKEVLERNGLSVDFQTYSSLVTAEYLGKGTASQWARVMVVRSAGNPVRSFSADTGDAFFLNSGSPTTKKKIWASLIDSRVATQVSQVNNTNKRAGVAPGYTNLPALNFAVKDLIQTEAKKIDWNTIEQFNWDQVMQKAVDDLIEKFK